jgi:uncharacterized OsmC-like protein
MSSRRTAFTGSDGSEPAGSLELPAGQPRAGAVLVHSLAPESAACIARVLVAGGTAVLNLPVPDGDVATVADAVVSAARHLASRTPATLLVGHGSGGAAVVAAASALDDVRAVATIGAPAAELAHATNLRRPLLLLHSPTDEAVGVENARALFEAARHPVSFVALDGADHRMSRQSDAEFAAGVVAAWSARYLEVPPADPDDGTAGRAGADPADGAVAVAGSAADGMRHLVAAGRHRLVLDEPAPTGTGTGPTPYDTLLAALGACTAMTMRLYADRKGWPLEDVTVALRHDRIHARDCTDCETVEGRLDRVRREISIEGPLDTEQRTRLVEIANRCPVHRTLTSEVVIETREV